MARDLTPVHNSIQSVQPKFAQITQHDQTGLNFVKEAGFAMQAVRNNDLLAQCAPQSFTAALTNVAAVGLTLNPVLGYAALVPRGGQAVLDVMYRGLIKLATDSGVVKSITVDVVYSNDEFDYEMGSTPWVKHKPAPLSSPRGDCIGAYCIAKLPDGGQVVTVLRGDELSKIEGASKAKSGPWKQWPDEMRKKAAIKRAQKYWPKSSGDDRLDRAISILNEHEGNVEGAIEAEAVVLVSDQQVADLTKAIEASGMKGGVARICNAYGISALYELPASKVEEVEARIDQYIAAKSAQEPEQPAE